MHWNADELRNISVSDDLKISPFREDGKTYGTPTWIWSVVVDGELYVRAYHGQNSTWYRAAMQQKAGRVHVAGIVKEVTFEATKGALNDEISNAYKIKYKGSPYLNAMIGDRACAATVKINPQE